MEALALPNTSAKLAFTNRSQNAVVYMSSYSSDGHYTFLHLARSNNHVNREYLVVANSNLTAFKDSLLRHGFKAGIKRLETPPPTYTAKLVSHTFDHVNPDKDSVFTYTLELDVQQGKQTYTALTSSPLLTTDSKQVIELNLAQVAGNCTSHRFKGTNIHCLIVELDAIASKAPKFVTASTVMDYNNCMFLYY